MSITRSRLDTSEGVASGARIYGEAFLDLKKENDPYLLVSNYRQGVEDQLKHLDEKMSVVLTDISDRTMWADRMRSCIKMMRTISMNLAVWGKPEWDWGEIAGAMGYLRAVTEGAEMTLGLNEQKQVETAATP